MPSDARVIYSMVRVGRSHPPNKQGLRDSSLGFYYGARTGVLGLNGAGKSTRLRIMARVFSLAAAEVKVVKPREVLYPITRFLGIAQLAGVFPYFLR